MSDSVQLPVKIRNTTLDLLKLIAALCIVSLHVGYFPELSPNIGDFIRYSMRWAVPFFFISFGYFISDFSTTSYYFSKLQKILLMGVVASIIYLPAIFYRDGMDALNIILSFEILFAGTFVHLWFFSSLFFGLLTLNLLSQFNHNFIVFLSTVLVLAYLIFDILRLYGLNGSIDANFFRYLSSISFLYLGFCFRKPKLIKIFSRLKHRYIMVFLLASLSIEFAALFFTGGNMKLPQFGISSCFLAIIIFSLCIKYPNAIRFQNSKIANISLGIYIFHPLILAISYKFMLLLKIDSSIFLWVTGCVFATITTLFLSRFFPSAFRLVNGVLTPRRN
jgi:surface polysaccharide O-acyltransferase-like enzyme